MNSIQTTELNYLLPFYTTDICMFVAEQESYILVFSHRMNEVRSISTVKIILGERNRHSKLGQVNIDDDAAAAVAATLSSTIGEKWNCKIVVKTNEGYAQSYYNQCTTEHE